MSESSVLKKTVSTKKLKFTKKYNDFIDFYGENKVTIYQNIIKLFKTFKNTQKTNLELNISVKIKDLDFETKLEFSRNDVNMLISDLLPYFENIEEYEICDEIKSLYNDLNK